MKRRQWILFALAISLMVSAVVALAYFKSRQRLGAPGLKFSAIPGELKVNLELPTDVPGYSVTVTEPAAVVTNMLPPDTSIAQVTCRDFEGREIHISAVMMGTDRTSIHKPQYCLPGQGFAIDDSKSSKEIVRIDAPVPFDLPVMRVVASRVVEVGGQKVPISGVYVYWFVAADAVTEDHAERIWWMAKHLLQSGELQRWAYVSYFTTCFPGEESAAFNRIKSLMQATVPRFQTARPESSATQPQSPTARPHADAR